MAGILGRKVQQKLAEAMSKRSHFSKDEVDKLLDMWGAITAGGTRLDRNKFRDVLHNTFDMTDDILMDRVFRAFDKDMDSNLSQEEWVLGLSVFLRGTLEERVAYCFNVYDMNNDGYISREEMFQMLKNSMVKQTTEEDPDEGIKDIVELVLKKMDHDHDNRLSMDDFMKSVKEEDLLLEAFGPCLPDTKYREKFLADLESGSVCMDISQAKS